MIAMTKTSRFLLSFQSVDLLPEHRNYGDQTPTLRDYGIAGSIASKLIAWGETEELVCTFENERGVSPNAHSWKPAFIKAAVAKHLSIWGEQGRKDLTPELLSLLSE